MIHQHWLKGSQWERDDPKLKRLRQAPVTLAHTGQLAASIELDPPGILMVRGPRQAGKSTFLRQFARRCLSAGVDPHSLGLLDAERCESWQELLAELEGFLESHPRSILLIDEVTSVNRWWKAVKIVADEGLTEQSLIVCTGSNAMDLAEGADLLPGRRGERYPVDFVLLPVRYRDVASHLSLNDYLLTGGMPWAIREFLSQGFIPSFVYSLYAGWIEGALTKRGHPRAAMHLPTLLHYLARRIGSPLSVTSLARDCNIGSNSTAESILSILERNFALLVAHWSEPGSNIGAARKNRKFFAVDPLLFHVFTDFGKGWESTWEMSRAGLNDSVTTSRLVENLVASELRHTTGMFPLRYFRGRKEIDFTGSEFIEVKYQKTVGIAEFLWVKEVIPSDSRFTVITRQTRSRQGNIRLIPLEDWLLRPANRS